MIINLKHGDIAMKKTFTIKIKDEELKSMEKIAASEYRSVTQQIQKIINEFVKNNSIKSTSQNSKDVFK